VIRERSVRTPRPLSTAAALALGAGLAVFASGFAVAQQQQQPSAAPAAKAAQRPATPAANRPATRPAWNELSADQQQALRPLAAQWTTMSEAQKRKWIELSRNYRTLPPDGQAKLHSRMSDWVALSPQQRTQARLNFGETKDVSADDKRAKWEAYQALSPEEKRKLAAGGPAKTPPTAAAVRPVPAQKLARVPPGSPDSKPPRIAAGPQNAPATPPGSEAQH
jgi:hypothetical protein